MRQSIVSFRIVMAEVQNNLRRASFRCYGVAMAKLEDTPTLSTQKAATNKKSASNAASSKSEDSAETASKKAQSGNDTQGSHLKKMQAVYERMCKSSSWLQNVFYAIWSVVGLIAIGLFVAALIGVGSLSLGDSDAIEPQQQPPETAQPQQPPQPTQEQLDCVREQVGDERFAELEQGEFADDEESVIIQECLQ